MRLSTLPAVQFGSAKTDVHFIRSLVERTLQDNKVTSFSKIMADKTLGILIWTPNQADADKTIAAIRGIPKFRPTTKSNEFLYGPGTGWKVGIWVDTKLDPCH